MQQVWVSACPVAPPLAETASSASPASCTSRSPATSSVVRSPEDAAEAIAETFTILWRRLDSRPSHTASVLAAGSDDRVARAFAALSAPDREVLSLLAWEGLTREELSVALGVSRAAVRLRLHRARRRFERA
jgi:predicted DNA-binding protein (UPF0251 family)